MYDPIETQISFDLLKELITECRKQNIKVEIIGGWATYFYVNESYRRAFGKDYMGSRDIDICFDHSKEEEFLKLIKDLGYIPNGMPFRWEKIYNRETKKFLTEEEAEKEQIFNLIKIFLDIFCDGKTEKLKSWNLPSLRNRKTMVVSSFEVTDVDTLIDLKCHALFERDKADKENKDACDLYSLIRYSNQKITLTPLLKKAIEKILNRSDLLYTISQHVLLDAGKQNIVQYILGLRLQNKLT